MAGGYGVGDVGGRDGGGREKREECLILDSH
jgi:hypothetical protein